MKNLFTVGDTPHGTFKKISCGSPDTCTGRKRYIEVMTSFLKLIITFVLDRLWRKPDLNCYQELLSWMNEWMNEWTNERTNKKINSKFKMANLQLDVFHKWRFRHYNVLLLYLSSFSLISHLNLFIFKFNM